MPRWKRLIGLRQPDPDLYALSDAACNPTAGGPQVTPAPGDDAPAALEIRYLGTAGFVISDGRHTVVLDPYLTRPGLLASLTRPLVPDTALIARLIPEADDVLIGHAHYDHILDAPDLCRQTGARLIGSSTAVQVGIAAGLPPEQLLATAGREDIASGPWTVRGLPSLHGRIFGRTPFPGDLHAPPPWPPRMADLPHGLVLNWLVDTGGLRVMHIDSADFIDTELAGHRCDIVCLCAIGRQARPNYVRDIVKHLRPKWIIPCHWDTMITPVEAEPDLLPGVDLPGFLREIEAEGVTPLLTPILGRQLFDQPGDAGPA